MLDFLTSLNFSLLNSLHPNISMHSLHTVLSMFPKVLTRRIWSTIRSFSRWLSIPLFFVSLHEGMQAASTVSTF